MAKNLGIKKGKNKKGETIVLTYNGESYGVWRLCENYDGKVRGGISKTWRYIVTKTNKAEAEKVFNRRTV